MLGNTGLNSKRQELNQVPGLEERALKAYKKGDVRKPEMLTQYTLVNLLNAYNEAEHSIIGYSIN